MCSGIVDIAHRQTHHRLAGLVQLLHCGVEMGIVRAFQTYIGKDAIVAVHIGIANLLQVDRCNSLPLFAGRFSNQLLEPRSHIVDRR